MAALFSIIRWLLSESVKRELKRLPKRFIMWFDRVADDKQVQLVLEQMALSLFSDVFHKIMILILSLMTNNDSFWRLLARKATVYVTPETAKGLLSYF